MYPLLFQETCSIEIITIGGLLVRPFLLSLSHLSHILRVFGFSLTLITITYHSYSHTHTLLSLCPIGFGFCVSGYHSFTHTYCASFTIIFISILPVSPTGCTGCFIGFWFMIFIMSPFLPHIHTCHSSYPMLHIVPIIMMRKNQTSHDDSCIILVLF